MSELTQEERQSASANPQNRINYSTLLNPGNKNMEGQTEALFSSENISKKNGKTVTKELTAIAAGIILTWFIFWAYLTWDNFSSHYSADTLANRAKAATLFVFQIMSLFLLAYGGLMYWFSRESIYIYYIVIAVVFIFISILSTSLEWLST
jgi:hypothetical protein